MYEEFAEQKIAKKNIVMNMRVRAGTCTKCKRQSAVASISEHLRVCEMCDSKTFVDAREADMNAWFAGE